MLKSKKLIPKSQSKKTITDDPKQTHKYTKYYPSILEPNFSHKISTHKIFKRYKLITNTKKINNLYKSFETNKSSSNGSDGSNMLKQNFYTLKPTQKLLRNFMSPYTPYRGLLIYHEMGVGKTCTAITIAEVLKNIVTNSDTKIYVLRPDEIERQIFNINLLKDGNELNQCTGDTYLQNPKYNELIDNCRSGDNTSCDQLKNKIDKDIKKIYEFTGSQTWANSINNEINMKTKNTENESDKENIIKKIISNKFDNSVIIVDEAHYLRDSAGKDSKVVPPVLNMVLKYSSNLRLILLSATPIYDKPQNIISMINYFLINDKRQPMKESDIFDSNSNLKPNGREILESNIKGYVSYLRGNNPYIFPIRLSAKYNIPNQMLNLSQYPKKDINGKQLNKEDRIKHLELINCPIQGVQSEIINYYIKNEPHQSNDHLLEELDELDQIDSVLHDYDDVSVTSNNDETNKNNDNTNSSSKSSKSSDSSKKSIKQKSNKKSESNNNNTHNNNNNDEKHNLQNIAYIFERQLSNFVFQSLSECNNNIKMTFGKIGLNQIANKLHGKNTYEFKDPEYGKRFKLPELQNWGIKIAKVVERALVSNGPIFIYTSFVDSGVMPIAFALEMNGYKRYKQNGTPLLENKYKDKTNRGDYIIYTGDLSLSQYAKQYLDKGIDMIKEKTVKIFIGTSKASESLNLFGYREVHIVDPWHNINLIEQSIGRVIRTGSHLHLPPQERNVTVYQYATTLGDRESYDLIIYRLCEDKAIKAGVVEKILKENAFDCELNKDANIYDTKHYGKEIPLLTSNNIPIKVSLNDVEYSRSCFYMKDCNFKCSGSSSGAKGSENELDSTPIMKFNIDKDIEEFKNLIKQLMQSSFNIKIDMLKKYLRNILSDNSPIEDEEQKPIANLSQKKKLIPKNKSQIKIQSKYTINNTSSTTSTTISNWDDEEAFDSAIQEIINTDTIIIDKYKRKGKIVLAGEYLRFIPENSLEPNIAIQKQNLKPISTVVSSVNLKRYINILDEKQKRLMETEIYDYDHIVLNLIIEKADQIYYGLYLKEYKFNVKITKAEVISLVFSRLQYLYKLTVLTNLISKKIQNIKLDSNEQQIEPNIRQYIIYIKDIFPNSKLNSDDKDNIYGFIIQNFNKLELFNYVHSDKKFVKNIGNLKKVREYKKESLDKSPPNKIYGFLKYEKDNSEPVFKITDNVTKGEKKSVRGITCSSKSLTDIKKNLNKLDDRILKNKIINQYKFAMCNDIELLMKRNDISQKDNKKWFYTPEEYTIFFNDT